MEKCRNGGELEKWGKISSDWRTQIGYWRKEGEAGVGDKLVNKENDASEASKLTDSREDLRGSNGRGGIRELVRGGEGLRVL